jgi:Raf kinase inhibitor-like YbhB/YbcL family protein
MLKSKSYLLIIAATLLSFACVGQSNAYAAMRLKSSAFDANGRIPVEFTCSGEGKSPALSWDGAPASAKALALIVKDPDAPSGNFVHWVMFNIPPSVTSLPEAIPATAKTSFGAIQGQNGRGDIGYTGPCPPPGKDHHYHFRLYALDENLPLTSDADAAQVEATMRGHIVGETELVGIFSR